MIKVLQYALSAKNIIRLKKAENDGIKLHLLWPSHFKAASALRIIVLHSLSESKKNDEGKKYDTRYLNVYINVIS